PALAQMGRGGGGGANFGGGGGGVQVGGGGGGMRAGGGASFSGIRGAQANIGAPRVGAVSSGSFAARSSGQVAQSNFAQGNFQGGFRDGRRFHRGFGPGFVAGLAVGGFGYGYDPYYYSDDYAYNDYYDDGYVVSGGVDPAYCAQRYRAWDSARQTS